MRAPADGLIDQRSYLLRRKLPVGVSGKWAGGLLVGIDDCDGSSGSGFRDSVVCPCREHVAAKNQIGLAGGDALSLDVFRARCDANVRCDGAIPSSAPMVMTPVPPIPVISML